MVFNTLFHTYLILTDFRHKAEIGLGNTWRELPGQDQASFSRARKDSSLKHWTSAASQN